MPTHTKIEALDTLAKHKLLSTDDRELLEDLVKQVPFGYVFFKHKHIQHLIKNNSLYNITGLLGKTFDEAHFNKQQRQKKLLNQKHVLMNNPYKIVSKVVCKAGSLYESKAALLKLVHSNTSSNINSTTPTHMTYMIRTFKKLFNNLLFSNKKNKLDSQHYLVNMMKAAKRLKNFMATEDQAKQFGRHLVNGATYLLTLENMQTPPTEITTKKTVPTELIAKIVSFVNCDCKGKLIAQPLSRQKNDN